jgi:heavy metal efflux system protein
VIDRLVEFSLRARVVVLIAALLVAIVGVKAFTRLPIEAYPDVADTWVQLIVQWPGHAAEEVERQITVPTERVMNGVPHQTAVRSTSIAGLSVVTLLFEDGTDTQAARTLVLERMGHIDLPPGADADLGPLASPVGEILRYRLVSCATTPAKECQEEDKKVPPIALSEMKDLEEWVVERDLLATPGVADVISFGGTTKQYQVLLDPAALAARSLTLEDVEKALAEANGNAGGGVVAFGRASLNVRGIGLLTPDKIGDVPVAVRDGTAVRVRHVGKVQLGHKERLGRVSVQNDRDVVAATVLLRKGEQAETVLAKLHDRIQDINARVLPRGVKISPYYDRTELMEHTTKTVLHNMLEGIALITVILFLFLGNTRAALIVAVTIPISLLFAFIFMDVGSIPANLLSIGAIDFGMIVDGAIFVVENVFRVVAEKQEKNETYDLREVVRSACKEVARPVAFSIAIIVTSYVPIFMLERVEGKLFRPLAFTVAFALAGALIASVTVVPVLTTLFFRGKLREMHNPVLHAINVGYKRLLERFLRAPRRVFAFVAIILVANVFMGRAIGSEFLPHLDEGSVWMRASLPANISLAEAEALVDGVHDGKREVVGLREILEKYPEVKTMAVQIGRPDDGTDPSGFYNAEFLMVLTDRSEWRKAFPDKDALVRSIEKDVSVVPGVTFGFSQPISDNVEEALTGVKGELAVKISGDDLHALDDLADKTARTIKTVPGVVDLGVFRELGQSNVHVEIVRERAERFGLSVQMVEDIVEKGIGGHAVTEVYERERHHELVVRFAAENRESVDAIRNLLVPVPGGMLVPLSQVADVTVVGGASRIYRENGRRYIAVKFGIRERDLGGAVDEAQRKVADAVKLPPGYSMEWGGEFESQRRAAKRLSYVVPATMLALIVILFALFRKPREALLVFGNVLLTSPVGGMAALLLTGQNFSVSSGVGFLALFGASIQTGVILVTTIDEERERGASIDEAVEKAAEQRLRPILMTALVATLGLLPAALSTGIGSDSQKPLAIVVVGGLFSSLLLSLFTLPALYKVFAERRSQDVAAWLKSTTAESTNLVHRDRDE